VARPSGRKELLQILRVKAKRVEEQGYLQETSLEAMKASMDASLLMKLEAQQHGVHAGNQEAYVVQTYPAKEKGCMEVPRTN
jgi:PDZ domain-containing secreted protein